MKDSKSIAVLPFINRSANSENEYFSDGLTEEIINALTKIVGLKVTARTTSFAFKNVNTDVREIGKKLNVSLVLEGSVRKHKNKLRVTAQLIRTLDGFHIWSENFDRQLIEVLDLQDEISLLIADKIRERYGHLAIADQLYALNTKNIEAYQSYLKGKQHYNNWSMSGFAKAAQAFEECISLDPSFDLPYFGAGLCYSFLGSWGSMDRKEAFKRVNEFFSTGNHLNIESSYRYYSIAKHLFWGLWDFAKAYDSLSKAHSMLPQDAGNNEFMSEIHALSGNFRVANKHIDTSLQINPLSPTHYYTKGQLLFLDDRLSEAASVLEKGISIDPTFSISRELRVSCLILMGDEARFKNANQDFDLESIAMFEALYDLVHHQKDFDNSLLTQAYHPNNNLLLAWDLYVVVHQKKHAEAIDLLHQKIREKMGHVLYLKYDPWLKPLYGIEAFREIVKDFNPNIRPITPLTPKIPSPLLTDEESKIFSTALLQLMESENVYLEPQLGLKDLAKQLQLHPNKLSWLLNDVLNKNFYEFVNGYRLQYFQQLALEPKNKHLSILGLALDSGFTSKSVFNDFFKKTVGQTPKEWLRENQ